MRVINVSFYYDNSIKTEEELLKNHFVTVVFAEALQRKGVDIIVMQRFFRDSYFKKNNVQYYFIKDKFSGNFKPWQLPYKFLKRIAALDADIVHLHTFPCNIPAFVLRFLLNKKCGMIIQNHGDKGLKGIRAIVYKNMSHAADAFFFTSVEQGQNWFKNRDLLKKVMPVLEGSPVFNFETWDRNRVLAYVSRKEARLKSGMQGNPLFLWVGTLDENKDPLTILRGMEILFKNYTKASLYLIYNDHKLLKSVQDRINSSESLCNRVQLLGKIPHTLMERYYNSADYFVLGSHYEAMGFSLSEALSCGCVPIVTDIPSFRRITDEGKLGALWETGNENAFVEAVQKVMKKPLEEEANNCIEFFKRNLSSDAIAATTVSHYKKIIAARNQKDK
ncbi:MAG TPA: glycosyltransferase family 4 protein [Parafilimonas sp.]|nr:glycosyltransferase family 4 protein [Parafilimonas sp.]